MAAPSAQELFESLRSIRNDPLIASVLRGDPEKDLGHNLKAASPTRSAVLAASASPSGAGTRVSDRDLQAAAAAHESNQFFRERDATRDSVGVGHWVQKHRDEVSAAEARRVENRLRAEKLFAQSQLDVEKFRLDEERLKRTGGQDSLHHSISDGGRERHSIERSAQTVVTDTAPALASQGASMMSNVNNVSQNLFTGTTQPWSANTAFLSPLHKEVTRFNSTASIELDTNRAFGAIDEDKNYAEKAKTAMKANGTNDSPTKRQKSSNRNHWGSEGHGINDPTRDEIAALREAVAHRDRVIHRLEQQLSQDRDYYEQELQRYKSEAQEERMASESRIASLRAQVDQLVTARAGRNAHETTIEEMTLKLQTVQRLYRESLDEVRKLSTSQHDALERACEERIKVVTQHAEEAIKNAKHAFLLERSEFLASQKERLVSIVEREQSLLLKEAEEALKQKIQADVSDKLLAEVEHAFRRHLQADIMPAVQSQLRADAIDQCKRDLDISASGVFAEKALELLEVLKKSCEEREESFIAKFSNAATNVLARVRGTAAAGSVASGVQADELTLSLLGEVVRVDPNAQHRYRDRTQALQNILVATQTEEEKQKCLDQIHEEKVEVYKKRLAHLNEVMASEAKFAEAIRQQISNNDQQQQRSGGGIIPSAAAQQTSSKPTTTSTSSFTVKAEHMVSSMDSSHLSAATGDAPPWALQQ